MMGWVHGKPDEDSCSWLETNLEKVDLEDLQ